MNNILEDMRLTSDQQYPSGASAAMTVDGSSMFMQTVAIAVALMVTSLGVGLYGQQMPQGIVRSSMAYSMAWGEGFVASSVMRNTIRVQGITRIVGHSPAISPLFEDEAPLPKVDRLVTRVRGHVRQIDHRAPISSIEEEA